MGLPGTLSALPRRLARLTAGMLRYVRLGYGLTDLPALLKLGVASVRSAPPSDAVIFRPRNMRGIRVEINAAEPTHHDVLQEVVRDLVYDLRRLPFAPDLVLDCGGHVGFFTALAAGAYGKDTPIVTFEPNPANAAYVRRLIERNAMRWVTLHEAAVSVTDGSARFFTRNSVGGSLSGAADGVTGAYDVTVVSLLKVLTAAAPDRLLLKMDIEGEEERLIPAVLPHLPTNTAIFFETHSVTGWRSVADKLESAGFLVQLIRGNRDPYRDGFALRSGSNA